MRITSLVLPFLTCLPSAFSYQEYNFSLPIDHFHNETRYEPHSDASFNLRYWFDPTHYHPGGPVFLIAAGETSGEDRFPFLSQGIVTKLAKEYHGLGVILEHRYYGTSYPVEEITPESLRFLTTEQALADYAYFASNVVFPGLEDHDLTAAATPWIAYGGSYAGAMVAFLRKVYPDVFWGAVSSSGVTAAIIDYWRYYEPIRNYGPADCIDSIQTTTDIVDRILIDNAENKTLRAQLQSAFGISPPINDVDFVSLISSKMDSFQARNWDPAVGSYEFRHYCDNITSPEILYRATNTTSLLPDLIEIAGYDASNKTLLTSLRNTIGYINATTPDSNSNPESEATSKKSKSNLPRTSSTSWSHQVCTEWGYFMPGSTVPATIRPLLSRLITLNSTSSFCTTDYNITSPPEIDRINKHGGLNFSFPRVAIIGGAADPWRDASPHAQGLEPRESNDSEPFILIEVKEKDVWDGIRGAVHHWDQNGVDEGGEEEGGVEVPRVIREVQGEIVRFVGGWLREWEGEEGSKEGKWESVRESL
ncbi:serine carboxypeptidase S28-domain-containing protein [Aspergillus karnatakaensis]|uniref:putative extracelular serine carboxypeptidase n=1 Tax=Aspergillus karnatakaensis TaxID=1810916 RepID=UPI003CCD154E